MKISTALLIALFLCSCVQSDPLLHTKELEWNNGADLFGDVSGAYTGKFNYYDDFMGGSPVWYWKNNEPYPTPLKIESPPPKQEGGLFRSYYDFDYLVLADGSVLRVDSGPDAELVILGSDDIADGKADKPLKKWTFPGSFIWNVVLSPNHEWAAFVIHKDPEEKAAAETREEHPKQDTEYKTGLIRAGKYEIQWIDQSWEGGISVVSNDGRHIVYEFEGYIGGVGASSLKLLDVHNPTVERNWRSTFRPELSNAVLIDDERIFLRMGDRMIRVISTKTMKTLDVWYPGEKEATFPRLDVIEASPDCHYLAASTLPYGDIFIWDTLTGRRVGLPRLFRDIQRMTFSSDSRRLACWSRDRIWTWDLAKAFKSSGPRIRNPAPPGNPVPIAIRYWALPDKLAKGKDFYIAIRLDLGANEFEAYYRIWPDRVVIYGTPGLEQEAKLLGTYSVSDEQRRSFQRFIRNLDRRYHGLFLQRNASGDGREFFIRSRGMPDYCIHTGNVTVEELDGLYTALNSCLGSARQLMLRPTNNYPASQKYILSYDFYGVCLWDQDYGGYKDMDLTPEEKAAIGITSDHSCPK